MGAFVKTLQDLFGVLGLPVWVAPVVIVVAVVLLFPQIRRNQSTARARRVLTAAFATGSSAERERLETEAAALVSGNADGLASLADIAIQRGRYALARRLVDELTALGTRPHLV